MNDHDYGLEHLQEGEYAKAKDVFESILYEDPNDLPALCDLGITFTEMGFNRKAIRTLEYYLKLDTKNPDVYEALGCAYYRIDEYDMARELFLFSLRLDHEHSSALRNLGVTYSRMKDIRRSYKYIQKSLNLDPEDYRTLYALSSLLIFLGDKKRALSLLDQLNEMDLPEDFRDLVEKQLKKLINPGILLSGISG